MNPPALNQRQLNREMKEADARMRQVDEFLRSVHSSFQRGSPLAPNGEVVNWKTPLDELIAREEEAQRSTSEEVARMLEEVAGATLPETLQEKIRSSASSEFQQCHAAFMEWLFAAGPHPMEVMRRLFAYTKYFRASLLWNMGFRQIGPLLGESHGAAQYRCRVLFGNLPAGWKKPASSIQKMRDAQKGNQNRRGRKGIKTKPKK